MSLRTAAWIGSVVLLSACGRGSPWVVIVEGLVTSGSFSGEVKAKDRSRYYQSVTGVFEVSAEGKSSEGEWIDFEFHMEDPSSIRQYAEGDSGTWMDRGGPFGVATIEPCGTGARPDCYGGFYAAQYDWAITEVDNDKYTVDLDVFYSGCCYEPFTDEGAWFSGTLQMWGAPEPPKDVENNSMTCEVDGVCVYYTFESAFDMSGFIGDCGSAYKGKGNLCDTSWASCRHSTTGRTSTTYVDGYTQDELDPICAQYQP